MSDRGRVLLVVGAVVLVAGGAGFWFFKIYQPKQALKAAQGEIAAWETRWTEARECLLGGKPGSIKTSEALAIREMAPDPWDRKRCTPLVSKLSRGLGDDTGVPPVESAWNGVDEAAKAAALAYANHVSGMYTEDSPLPAALDKLEAARAKLRTAAELPATTETGAPLPAAQMIPIMDGTTPLKTVQPFEPPSAHGLNTVGWMEPLEPGGGMRGVQVVLAPGAAPKVLHAPTLSVRAFPDLTWGALGELLTVQAGAKTQAGSVKVGAMDAEGAIATPQVLAVSQKVRPPAAPPPDEPAPLPLKAGEQWGSVIPSFATGSLADGAIVYQTEHSLVIARAKANVVTADPPIEITGATYAIDLDGRAVVAWETPDKVLRALLLRAGGEETHELPAELSGRPCMTKDRVYAQAGPQLLVFGGGQPLDRIDIMPAGELQGCTADAAIVREIDRHRELEICTTKCRKVSIPSSAPEYANVTSVGGKLIAVAMHAGVVGVWSEDKAPVFYALPQRAMPVLGSASSIPMALTDSKVIDVIASGLMESKNYVIRLPVP